MYTRLRKASVVLALALSVTVNIPAQNPSIAAGRTVGTLDVTADGAANYTVPIVVPPGRLGMQPSLALVYNSSARDSLVGYGWQLSGFSEIRRCGRSIANDGQSAPVRFDSRDAFCLDGVRLVPILNHTCPSEAMELVTQIESNSKICGFGSGPDYFSVWTRNGRISQYGDPDKTSGILKAGTDIAAWGIRRISDRSGNFIQFDYGNPGEEPVDDGTPVVSSFADTFYPLRISYTGNVNLRPSRSIILSYEHRPDEIVGYLAGHRFKNTKRLCRIITYGPEGRSLEYRLTYEQSPSTGRSRLIGVQECADQDVCKGATTLSYSDRSSTLFKLPASNYSSEILAEGGFIGLDIVSESGANDPNGLIARDAILSVGDFDGDGHDEIWWADEVGQTRLRKWHGNVLEDSHPPLWYWDPDGSYTGIPLVLHSYPYTIDIDNDGVAELLLPSVDYPGTHSESPPPYEPPGHLSGMVIAKLEYMSGRPLMRTREMPRTLLPSFSYFATPRESRVLVGDFDGDGFQDIVYCQGWPGNWLFSRNSGQSTPMALQTPNLVRSFREDCDQDDGLALDVDGDGSTELLLKNPLDPQIFQMLKFENNHWVANDWFANDLALPPRYCPDSKDQCLRWDYRLIADVNGDGLPDIVMPTPQGVETWINTGRNFVRRVTPILPGSVRAFQNARVLDFNHDGRDDILVPYIEEENYLMQGAGFAFCSSSDPNCGYWIVYLSTTDGFKPFNTRIPVFRSEGGRFISPVTIDLRADGFMDIVIPQDTYKNRVVANVFVSDHTQPDKLVSIRTGTNPATGSDGNTPPPDFRIFWAHANDRDVYEPASEDVCRNLNNSAKLRVVCVKTGLTLVASVESYTGTGLNIHRVTYKYYDARSSVSGRGWLGFASQVISDRFRRRTTTIEYGLDKTLITPSGTCFYPLARVPTKITVLTLVTSRNGQVLYHDETTLNTYSYHRAGYFEGYEVLPVSHMTTISELPDGLSPGIPFREISRFEEQLSDYDAWGNAQRIERSWASPWPSFHDQAIRKEYSDAVNISAKGSYEVTIRKYYNDERTWLVGLLEYEETQVFGDYCNAERLGSQSKWFPQKQCPASGEITKKRWLTYDSEKGFLLSDTVEAGGAEPLRLLHLRTSIDRRDSYGNAEVVTVAGDNGHGDQEHSRTTWVEFDSAEHMFAVRVHEPRSLPAEPSYVLTRAFDLNTEQLRALRTRTDCNPTGLTMASEE